MKRIASAIGLGVLLAGALAGTGCGGTAEGAFRAEGPQLGKWAMQPDTCLSGLRHGLFGADLFRHLEGEDTELVVAEGVVLARMPGTGKMQVFTREDCAVLEVDTHFNGVRVNGIPGISGSVRLACERAGVGRIEGAATFSCY